MIVSDKELAEHDAKIEAMSRTHAELQQYHYQALKNPNYIIENLPDVLREQMQMPESLPVEPTEKIIYHTHHLNSKDLDRIDQNTRGISHLLKKKQNLTTIESKKMVVYRVKE